MAKCKVYLVVVDAREKEYDPPKLHVARMLKGRPKGAQLRRGQVAVGVELVIPDQVFRDFVAEAVVQVHPDQVVTPEVRVAVEGEGEAV